MLISNPVDVVEAILDVPRGTIEIDAPLRKTDGVRYILAVVLQYFLDTVNVLASIGDFLLHLFYLGQFLAEEIQHLLFLLFVQAVELYFISAKVEI